MCIHVLELLCVKQYEDGRELAMMMVMCDVADGDRYHGDRKSAQDASDDSVATRDVQNIISNKQKA